MLRPIRSFALASILLACSSSKSTDAPAADAGPTNTPPGTPIGAPAPVTWTQCNTKFECGSVEVPVDYDQPAGPRISIAVMRAPADDPTQRIGSLLVNPGGPGIPMIEQLVKTYSTLRIGFPKLAARFDVVAFDWRGVGQSAAVHCVDDAFIDSVRGTDLTLPAGGDLAAARTATQTLAQGCKDHADALLMAHMDTDTAARDLERLRAAVGDEKLTFIGFSYGTFLGGKYASLFPDHVRALALDSGVVPLGDIGEEVKRHAKGYDTGLGRFFDACAPDASCAFHGGTDAQTLATKFDELLTKARTGGITSNGRTLSAVDFEFAVADGLRNGKWKDFAVDLSKAETGDGTGMLRAADTAAGRRADGTYDGGFIGAIAIGCLDQAFTSGTTLESFRDLVNGIGTRGAVGAAVPWALCIDWPYKRTAAATPISAKTAPRSLIVGSRFDAITSYDQTENLITAMGNGSYSLTYEGDGHAAALHSTCVRDVISDFLIDPTAAPSKTSCPAE